jgi:AcrR family transcriptional regulator
MPKIVDHDQRRDEIALVACRVVADYGFDQATVVRIAREAGYTTGMVAHYFDTKQDIIIAALRLILRRIEERLTRPAGQTTAGSAAAADRSVAGGRAALHRMCFLDRLLGPGVGRQAPETHQRLGASRIHAPV